ncbi:MAG TPA: M14 family metallopeptidase, partial [Candidatus Paceibacterota bacterium]|nr:M14 family metallopeptidase [Candidatus Paceibacterota bacterium]
MKNTTIVVSLLVIIGLIIGIYFFTKDSSDLIVTDDTVTSTDLISSSTDQVAAPVYEKQTIIGSSLEKRDIVAYNYGTGEKNILFVGGIHGGYEWNTSLLAYELMDYLEANPNIVPDNIKITVIPVLNPDGLNKVVGTAGRFAATDVSSSAETVIEGRFNSRGVDLNRNFDCGWQADGVWQKMKVSGGSQAFSEPESQAIKNYVVVKKPSAVVVWFSAAGGVFSSNCQ